MISKDEIIRINEEGWNNLIKSNKPFANTTLPEYGPFLKKNENELNLLGDTQDKIVLDLGSGSGDTIKYLKEIKKTKEIWGIDISKEQINKTIEKFPELEKHLIISPMEKDINIRNYFDIVVSIFSIGYTSDLDSTFKNVSNYLKKGGIFIVSWTHPFYYCLDLDEDNKVIVSKSYFNDSVEMITKGTAKIQLAQTNVMISTMINAAQKAGLYLDKMLEEETIMLDTVNGYNSPFWKKEKTKKCPSTVIYVFKKI